MKQVIGKSQHRFTTGKSFQTDLVTFESKVTLSVDVRRAADIVYMAFSKVLNTVSPQFLPDKIQVGWVVCEMGGKLANGPHTEGGDQWLLFKLAACHKWGPPGIDTGPHAVQHLHT